MNTHRNVYRITLSARLLIAGMLFVGYCASAAQVIEPPAVVTVTQPSAAAQVTITWDASVTPGVEAYRVFRSGGSAQDAEQQIASRRTERHFNDNDVVLGKTYTYLVAAIIGETVSDPSAPVSVTLAFPAPSNLTARDTSAGEEIELAWDSPAPGLDVRFDIYRATSESDMQGERIKRRVKGVAYTDTTVSNGITYYYWIRAELDGVESEDSARVSVSSRDTVPPAAPHSVSARTKTDGEARISWSAPRGESNLQYVVYRSNSTSIGTQQVVTSNRSYTEYGLTDGATYYYRVQAVDSAGNRSLESDPVKVIVQNDTNAELAVANLTATATGRSGQVSLRWKKPSRSTYSHLKLYRSTSSGSRGELVADRVRGTSYRDKELIDNIQYYYTVVPVSETGQEHSEQHVSATPYDKSGKSGGSTAGLVPPGVNNLRARDNGDGAGITLTWVNPALHVYRDVNIYRSTDFSVLGDRIVAGLRASEHTDDQNIRPDIFYYYTVKTTNEDGTESIDNTTVRGVASVVASGEGGLTDTDGDGLSDDWERHNGFHPRFKDQTEEDFDDDGLTLLEEFENNTNPWDPDTDGDGFNDGTEVFNGYNPIGPGAQAQIIRAREQVRSGTFAYGLARLPSLNEEQQLAQELRTQLEEIFGQGRIPNPRSHWPALINAYIYGGYTVQEIADTLRRGPGLVHPSVAADRWRNSEEYRKKSL